MPRKSKTQRNAEQGTRQQRVRDEAKARRRPSRDDLARVLLWPMIVTAQGKRDASCALGIVRDVIVEQLDRQGLAYVRVRRSSTSWPKPIPMVSFPFDPSVILNMPD